MSEKDLNSEKYILRFTDSAFSPEEQRSNLQGRKKYTREVADAQKDVEILDSRDDFRELLIDAGLYEQKGSNEYGIKRKPGVHVYGGDVILKHQKAAATQFLRDLRGFGLLADVVGSGKTFEAGVILSELAARDKVKSLIVVTPDQVFGNWVEVLEDRFGMGKDVLYKAAKEQDVPFPTLDEVLGAVGVKRDGEFIRPARPILVDVDIFAQWRYVPDFLADVVVVDEAHHLSEDSGKYAGAMRLLSEMMQTKKRAEATYCLLLTATPHSGNLENMFRLWYFVRCKGGNPPDFDEKDDKERSAQYLDEKEYYKNYICHGASNVTEFIRKVKLEQVTQTHKAAFESYLRKVGRFSGYEKRSEYDLSSDVDEFLALDENAEIEKAVISRVSSLYHNSVLRSIMIRQPNELSKTKDVHDFFFFPTSEKISKIEILGVNDEKIEVDFSAVPSEGGFPTVKTKGETLKLDEYLDGARGNRPFQQAYSRVFNNMINKLAELNPESGKIHTKYGYSKYYAARIKDMREKEARNAYLYPVKHTADKLSYKLECAKAILSECDKNRVLIFFDYDAEKEDRVGEELVAALKNDKKFAKRIIVGDATSYVKKIEAEFNEKSDAILIALDRKFTEGANLQESNVIINFQVTPDPLAMDQRIGRIFRLGQKSNVKVYSLADMNKLEGFALAYFGGIGLMSSNSGDATILAGSNSEQMVALRCNVCSRVKLMSRQEYEQKKKNSPEELICKATQSCKDLSIGGKGTEMAEITVYDFKCDCCGTVLTRSVSDGYMCLSNVSGGEHGRMCNSGEKGDRSIYCRKICALSHCRRFKTDPALKDKCSALKEYARRPTVSDAELMKICAMCNNRVCWDQCKITGSGKSQISDCSICEYAGCEPAPHVLEFDEKWEASCPMEGCKNHRPRGKLRPVVARTFATFVTELWKFNHDGGESFCTNLGKEAAKVFEVSRILSKDELGGEVRN